MSAVLRKLYTHPSHTQTRLGTRPCVRTRSWSSAWIRASRARLCGRLCALVQRCVLCPYCAALTTCQGCRLTTSPRPHLQQQQRCTDAFASQILWITLIASNDAHMHGLVSPCGVLAEAAMACLTDSGASGRQCNSTAPDASAADCYQTSHWTCTLLPYGLR